MKQNRVGRRSNQQLQSFVRRCAGENFHITVFENFSDQMSN